MGKSFEQIKKDLQAKKYEPIYFLTGDEPYYIDYISNYIADNILSDTEKDFNQSIFYGKDAQVGAIREAAMRYPMMAQYNVIIVKEAQELKKWDELTSYIEHPNDSTILVFCYKYKKLDKRTKFAKSIKENTLLFEGKKVYENKMASWIENYVSGKEYQISQRASALLIEFLGNDMSKIANELEKLLMIKKDNKTIDLDDIEKNIGISKEYNIFELQKALGLRDHNKTAKIVNYIQANPKSNPIQATIGGLYNYFNKLFSLQYARKDFKIAAQELGVFPFLFNEYKTAMANYRGKLDKVIELLHVYDLKSKGIGDQNTDETELTKELLFRILSV